MTVQWICYAVKKMYICTFQCMLIYLYLFVFNLFFYIYVTSAA